MTLSERPHRPGAVAVLLWVILALAAPGCGNEEQGIWGLERGETAPDFELPLAGSENETLKLSSRFREHPVLLVFWASWCPPCVAEVPELKSWHEKYGAGGFEIIAVNVQEDPAAVGSFIEKHGINYTVVQDSDGKVTQRYGVAGLPVALVLAKGGEILYYGFRLPKIERFLELTPEP